MKKKVVVFGGGTGISFLLRGLKQFPVDITAVIAVSDDGSSTGKLREEFLMPAMGDIRKVITSLSDKEDEIKDLLEYRYDTYTDLDGHPVGNLIMVAMYNLTGSLRESIRVLSEFLGVKHKVLPLSEDYLTLIGETVSGEIIHGESAIGKCSQEFKKLYYDEKININDDVLKAVLEADLIIFSVGSLFTSIIPNLISSDIIKAIDKSKAKILYTCNAVGQVHETFDYTVSDHICEINKYLGDRKIDAVLAANSTIDEEILDKYVSSENKKLVFIDEDKVAEQDCELIEDDLLIVEGNYIRHDSIRLATAIFCYLLR